MSVAAIILAAGASRRLGRPKQLVEIEGETLLARAVRIASEAALSPIVVVVRDKAGVADHAVGTEAVLVMNAEADEGMASSIRRGVESLERFECAGAVLMTCDQPRLRTEHLRALAVDEEAVAGSAYAGRIGVPAYFPASAFESLLQLRGDVGARELLRNARAVDGEELALDLDTEADVQKAIELIGNERKSDARD